MFEGFNKGKRGSLAQSGGAYVLAEVMFCISNKVQEPAVNLSLSMNWQRAHVLGAACS